MQELEEHMPKAIQMAISAPSSSLGLQAKRSQKFKALALKAAASPKMFGIQAVTLSTHQCPTCDGYETDPEDDPAAGTSAPPHSLAIQSTNASRTDPEMSDEVANEIHDKVALQLRQLRNEKTYVNQDNVVTAGYTSGGAFRVLFHVWVFSAPRMHARKTCVCPLA